MLPRIQRVVAVRRRCRRESPVADAMKPDFQGVRTHWNQGFMTFRKARRTPIVVLMIR